MHEELHRYFMRFLASFLVLVIISCEITGCSRAMTIGQAKPFPVGDYAYVSYDKKGDKVVEGRLSITAVETWRIGLEDVPQLKGNWELRKIGNQERIGAQVGSGDLTGSIVKGQVIINLNPNIHDANVILRGTIDGKRFHGTWSFNGYAGPLTDGTFEAVKK